MIFALGFMVSLSALARGEPACRAAVKSAVETSGGDVFLSDLLAADACPALARRAARVPLGKTPLAGSARVFSGEELRARLERLKRSDPKLREQALIFEVPERVVVRAAGQRASCREIWGIVGSRLGIATGMEQSAVECGAAERVRRNVQLESTRKSWDATLASWNLVARCRRPEECVPFLVRFPDPAARNLGAAVPNPAWRWPHAVSELRPKRELAVRPGQRATLVWEEKGLRLEIPVVCLDGGAKGETVRARVGHSGRTLRAIVMDSGTLRAIW
jgi:hypothetical protein